MRNIINTPFVTRALQGMERTVHINPLTRDPEPMVRPYASCANSPDSAFPDDRVSFYGHRPVLVTRICYVARRFRYARIAFNYAVTRS